MYSNTQKKLVAEYGNWISQWTWSHFGTFTFGRISSASNCEHHWNAFVNSLERYTRGRIGWVRATEGRWSGCGKPHIPLHYHALLVYKNVPPTGVAQAIWHSKSGDSKVEIFDPTLGAAWYISKMFPFSDFDYEVGGLEYFLDSLTPDSEETQSGKPILT